MNGTHGPLVTSDEVRLRLPLDVAPGGARLELDWPLDADPEFTETDGGWELQFRRPLVHRIEYQLRLRGGGGDSVGLDPTNPDSVPGPFGAKSELRFPDYARPGWLDTQVRGTRVTVDGIGRGRLAVEVPVTLFSPAGLDPDQPAPLLVSHDGTDMADRGGLLAWACAAEHPVRVALLDPPHGHRNAWYAADPVYADHVATAVLPALRHRTAVSAVIGLGASLGALSMMTIHRRHPDSVDALALQSGSFFRMELDGQESHWAEFGQVATAVEAFTDALPGEVRPVPVLLTVGAVEENRANNERMAGALSFQGYPVDARIVPDAHTVVGWRDAWYPGLNLLLEKVVTHR